MSDTYIGVMIRAKTVKSQVLVDDGGEPEDQLICTKCGKGTWLAASGYKHCPHDGALLKIVRASPEAEYDERERAFTEVIENPFLFGVSGTDAKFLNDNFSPLYNYKNNDDLILYKPITVELGDCLDVSLVADKVKQPPLKVLERLQKIMGYKKITLSAVIVNSDEGW